MSLTGLADHGLFLDYLTAMRQVGFYDLLKHVVTVSIGNADSFNAASGLLVCDHILFCTWTYSDCVGI